jgi:ATP-dependent Clp protease protease subunit
VFNRQSAGVGEIILYGLIGKSWFEDGISAAQFQKELKALGNVSVINLRIDSEGGVITDAQAMYNLLVTHSAKVNVFVDGIAASAASFLAMAGDTITIGEGSFFMIHEARGIMMGTAEDFRKEGELLATMTDMIAKKYSDRTGIDFEQIKAYMAEETWFTGSDAVKLGFADTIIANKREVACVSKLSRMYNNVPEKIRPRRAAVLKFLNNERLVK